MAAKTRTVKLSDARKDLDALMGAASKGERILVEKDGAPTVVLVSRREYEAILREDARREELFAALDRTQAAFKDVPPEELEREIERALTQVRREMAEERKSKAQA